jgi:hypothetical protein
MSASALARSNDAAKLARFSSGELAHPLDLEPPPGVVALPASDAPGEPESGAATGPASDGGALVAHVTYEVLVFGQYGGIRMHVPPSPQGLPISVGPASHTEVGSGTTVGQVTHL